LERKGAVISSGGAEDGEGAEPKVESLVRGILRLKVSEEDRRVHEGVKTGRRDAFIAGSVYKLVLNWGICGIWASGEIETGAK